MPSGHEPVDAAEQVALHEAWQCIGCGKIEAPQPCIGVCKDRKVTFVDAADFERMRADRDSLRSKLAKLGALAATVAYTTPHDAEWEQSWRLLQRRARHLLNDIG